MTVQAHPGVFSSVAARVAALDGLDASSLDRGGVQAALSSLGVVRGWHDGLHVRLTRRLAELAEESPSVFPEADIAAAAKTTRRSAHRASKRARALDAVPQLEQAMAAGQCSSDHADALARTLDRLGAEQREELAANGDRLAAIAASSTPEMFEAALKREVARLDPGEGTERLARQRRAARFRSWTDRDTGMVCFRGELDPETGVKVISRIEAASEALFHAAVPEDCPTDENKQDYLRAQAFTRLILRRSGTKTTADAAAADADADADADAEGDETAAGAHLGADAPPPDDIDIDVLDNRCEMMVVIDLETLLHGLHAKSIIDNGHDIDLPIESYRRMACLAAIIPIVLDSNGVCVDQGRDIRLANRKQRRALRAMYDTCGVPGCTVTSRHCEPHHIRWWRHWGRTDLNNLLPLCSRHHHAVHEGGWDIVMHPDRSLTITLPDGTIMHTGPPRRHKAVA